jgi:hypothetical protein
MLITGRPSARNFAFCEAMYLNCSSRSGCFAPGCFFFDLQRVAPFAQQPRDCSIAYLVPLLLQPLAEAPKAAAHPFLIAHWIAGDLVDEQPFECRFDTGILRLNELSARAADARRGMDEASG